MSALPQIVTSIASVTIGGSIVQALLAVSRRRSDMRKVDTGSDSIAIHNANDVVVMMRQEMERKEMEASNRIKQLESEKVGHEREITRLANQVSELKADLAVERSRNGRNRN
jgi:SMC interacting uncharacterized protein involved in chromosome segregation